MQKRTKLILVGISLMFFFPVYGQVEDWNQFRGKNRDGISTETGLLSTWPESGPEEVWRIKITDSFSQVVIVDDVVYTNISDTTQKPGSEILAAYSIETGEEIWRSAFDTVFIDPDGWGNGPRATPYVDGETIYVQSSFGKLAAIDKSNGEIKWKIDFMKEFGTVRPRWGYARTPVIVDDMLFAYAGGTENRAYVALDKHTGEVLWTKGKGLPECYTSPKVVEMNGVTNIVFLHDSMMVSLDKNGEELWSMSRTPAWAGNGNITFIEPNKFFVSRVGRVGSYLVEVIGNEVKELWTNPSMQENWNTAIHHKGYMYGFSRGKMVCISLEDGNAQWSERGFGKGSLIMVDEKLIVITERGILKLVETNPEMYVEKGSFKALDGKTWTAPSFYDGKLFLRNLNEMVVFNLK